MQLVDHGGQGRVARLNLAQHFVEPVDQHAGLAVGGFAGAQRVVARGRDAAHRGGQTDQRRRDEALQPRRQQVRHQQRDREDQGRKAKLAANLCLQLTVMDHQVDKAHQLAVNLDSMHQNQIAVIEAVVGLRRRAQRRALDRAAPLGVIDVLHQRLVRRVAAARRGDELAVGKIDLGREHARLLGQRGNDLAGSLPVAKRQCGRGIDGRDPRQHGHRRHHRITRRFDLVDGEDRRRGKQCERCRRDGHRDDAELDREGSQQRLHPVCRPYRPASIGGTACH